MNDIDRNKMLVIVPGSVAMGMFSYGLSNLIGSEIRRHTEKNIALLGVHFVTGAVCAGIAFACANAIAKSHTSAYLESKQTAQLENQRT